VYVKEARRNERQMIDSLESRKIAAYYTLSII
jgi:hypothetical protein